MSEPPRLHSIPGGRIDQPRSPRAAEQRAPRNAVPRERGAVPREPLWREALGERLRGLRQDQGEKLTETAGRAGISPQYLSEVERGRKEPSSEMIAALAGALGTTLGSLTSQVAADLMRYQSASVTHNTSSPVLLAA